MSDVFDLVIQQREKNGKIQDASFTSIEQEEVETPWYKAIPSDILIGLTEGLTRLGRTMGPLQGEQVPIENIRSQLEEALPQRPSFVGETLKRALSIAPTAIASPFTGALQAVGQSTASGLLGETAKTLGAGEGLQTVAEILPFLKGGSSEQIPRKGSKVSKKISQSQFLPQKIRDILGKRVQKAEEVNTLIEYAQNNGISAQELAPLLQGEAKKTILSKIASRGNATQSKLARSKQAIGNVVDRLKTGEFGEKVLSPDRADRLIGDLDKILQEMPAKTRNVILEDFQQLKASPKDTKSIIKFYRDIGAQYSEHKASLGRLKDPLKEALTDISPKLGQDFDITNQLFSRYYDISSKLKPTIASQILEYSFVPKISYGLFTGNYPLIVEAVGETAARKLAAKALTSPKFLGLGRKIVSALNKGQIGIANQIKKQYERELQKDFPKISDQLKKESFDFLSEE